MNFIENIFICLAAPLLIAVICMREKGRRIMIFLLGGMAMCLLSSYISTFLAAMQGADLISAAIEISPLVEEIMKLLPILFYLLIFEPDTSDTADAVMMTAVGFATFENVCFMIQNGADELLHLTIRGFGTGAMHVVAGSIISLGLLHLWNRENLRIVGVVAFLVVAVCYHGVFNLLVSQTGIAALIGYIIPLFTAILTLILRKRRTYMKTNGKSA